MTEATKARPVSGEIMTGAPSCGGMARAGDDIVDAEFEIVERGLPVGEARPPAPAPAVFIQDAPSVQGMDMLRGAEPAAATRPGRRAGAAFWGGGVLLAAIAFWVAGGHALVMRQGTGGLPTPASHLRIADVDTRVDRAGKRAMLFVDGQAVNDGREAAQLPPIEIRVLAPGGATTRYKLGTAERSIAPGGRFAFSSRLEVPKNGVESVSVAFVERGDASGERQGH